MNYLILLKSLFLGFLVLLSMPSAFAEGSVLVEDVSFDPNAIGQVIIFEENISYLILDESPKSFLENNMGISRMLATNAQAKGNDIHIKEAVPNGVKFEIITMYKYVHTDLHSWDQGARELYLDYSSRNPGIDYLFVLSDDKGVQSTVGIANLKKSSYEQSTNKSVR